ncbi:MAG: sugar ABC transporter permease [Hyphomicrobiales bacterium]|nr:sugar ABC transporter permease [Hyphomicrobiales bacterium]MDE2018013.1 sugar ABC transporter permease [Hyphomicrobiales bacterium]
MVSVADARAKAETLQDGLVKRFFRATEIDVRLLSMVIAMLIIWAGFDLFGIATGQSTLFTDPRNLWNLTVQTATIAIMATGMTLVIVMRQIDLSVGSMLSFVAVVSGVAQVYWLAPTLGSDHPAIWVIAVAIAIGLGALLGAFNGFLIAYAGIPAFIVTLGGLIGYSGAAWLVARGETVAPMDGRFELIGGNTQGSWLGDTWSIAIGALACLAIVGGLVANRASRRRFQFPQRPMWAEWFLGVAGCAIVAAVVWIVNAYRWPPMVAKRYAEAHGIPIPPGGIDFGHGFALPVVLVLIVGATMTFMATRTRFGRYVYAMGGNPEAAELAGVNTKRLTVAMFSLMGALVGLAACVSAARLDAASNDLGQFDELYVIAATVIGGTSLAGGLGTIYGAMVGALVMQSLQSGMTLLNIDSAVKDIVVGVVLVLAVWLDQQFRRGKA